MYQINFQPQLNTVDWTFVGSIKDANTNEDLDLSIYTWKFEILEPGSCSCVRLTASTGNGKFTIPELGIFQISFTDTEMGTLYPQSYPVRLTMELDGQSTGVSVGSLPIVCQ